MSGKHITDQQIRLYINERKLAQMRLAASAKSGVSERTGGVVVPTSKGVVPPTGSE